MFRLLNTAAGAFLENLKYLPIKANERRRSTTDLWDQVTAAYFKNLPGGPIILLTGSPSLPLSLFYLFMKVPITTAKKKSLISATV